MPVYSRIRELEAAKRLVVLQSDLHRQLIQMETTALRKRLTGTGVADGRTIPSRPILAAASVITGLLAYRHWRALARWAPSVFAAWRWWRSFIKHG